MIETPDLDALACEAFAALGGGLTRKICCGKGAYGAVWMATDAIGRRVAVKVVFKDAGEMWKREYAGVKYFCSHMKSGHPALLVVHHVVEQPCFICYSMEAADSRWPDGESYEPDTLAARLLKGPLPLETVRAYTSALMAGLRCLHETGLVHRDLKPENIFFVNGAVKIGDIGLVSVIRGDLSLVGTPGYMPGNSTVDGIGRDVYALGKVLYRLMSGYTVARFPLMPVELTRDPLFAPLNEAMLTACDPRPEHQFKNVAEFQAVWEALRPKRPRRCFYLVIPLLLLLALGAGLWLKGGVSDPGTDTFTHMNPERRLLNSGAEAVFTPDGLRWEFTPGGLDSLLIDFTGMHVFPGATLTLTVDSPVALDCKLMLYRSASFSSLPLRENESVQTLARFPVDETRFRITLPADLDGFDRLAVLYDSRIGTALPPQTLLLKSLSLSEK